MDCALREQGTECLNKIQINFIFPMIEWIHTSLISNYPHKTGLNDIIKELQYNKHKAAYHMLVNGKHIPIYISFM